MADSEKRGDRQTGRRREMAVNNNVRMENWNVYRNTATKKLDPPMVPGRNGRRDTWQKDRPDA